MSDKNVGPLLYVVSDIASKVAVAPVQLTEGQAFMVKLRDFRDAVDPRDQLLREAMEILKWDENGTPSVDVAVRISQLLGPAAAIDTPVKFAQPKPLSPDEVHLLRGVAQGLGQSAEKANQEWMGIVYQLKNTVVGNVWRDADKAAYDSAASMAEYERRTLYAAPDKQYRELALQLLDAQEKLKEARKLIMDTLDVMEYGEGGVASSNMYWRLRKYRDELQPGRQDIAEGRAEGMEPRAPKCGVCGQGAWACNESGCHYLESGNGAPGEDKS